MSTQKVIDILVVHNLAETRQVRMLQAKHQAHFRNKQRIVTCLELTFEALERNLSRCAKVESFGGNKQDIQQEQDERSGKKKVKRTIRHVEINSSSNTGAKK